MNDILVEIRPLKNSGALKAFADVIVSTQQGEICIKGFRVVQKDDAPAWIGLPQTSYQKNGEVKYVPLVDLGRKLKIELTKKILDEYQNIIP